MSGRPVEIGGPASGHWHTAVMDDTKRNAEDAERNVAGIGRRAFFSRALLMAGAATTLVTLTGCPGGEQDDGDDDDGGDDDD